MGFTIFIACTAALIGGWDGRVLKGYSTWPLSANQCSIEHKSLTKYKANLNTIVISCKNGNIFILPAAQCSVSLIKKK